jgi:hypothetical protein
LFILSHCVRWKAQNFPQKEENIKAKGWMVLRVEIESIFLLQICKNCSHGPQSRDNG